MKKNILFIIHCLPFPLNSGGRQAIVNGLLAIKEEYNIFITYPQIGGTDEEENINNLNKMLDGNAKIIPYEEAAPITPSKTIFTKLASLGIRQLQKITKPIPHKYNPYSYWIDELLPAPKNYIKHVNKIISDYRIDIVQCEMLRNVAFANSLPSTVKKVFVHHELGFARHALELESRQSDNFDGLAIWHTSKNLEVSQLNQYDCVITLSPIDKKKLEEQGVTATIKSSFAIVSPRPANKKKFCETYNLSFVGPDNHEPNVAGIIWFLENCWNTLLSKESRYNLKIIGKWNKKNIDTLTKKYSNLHFLGFVDDLEVTLSDTTLIVPIQIGSGIRMKILEAANLGIPFVSTSVGAEGIPVINNEHTLIADTPDDFIQAIIDMEKPEMKRKCTENARKLITNTFSFDALRQNRLAIYKSLYE